jgi:hypothetical protein
MININVITYCGNYNLYVYERFIGTLNDTGFNGTIFFIINKNDVKNMEILLKKYNNIKYYIDNITSNYSKNCIRYIYYDKIINENPDDFYLLCDGRDVLFQKNIEEFNLEKNKLYFFKENITFIQDKNWNYAWINQIQNQTKELFVDNIQYNSILCSGTIIGSSNILLNYLKNMINIMNRYNLAKPYNGIDQGIHNYLYYTNKLDNKNIILFDNSDIYVNTIGAPLSLNLPNLISYKIIDGKIYDKNNNLNYIVHQYDRMSLNEKKLLNHKYNFIDR